MIRDDDFEPRLGKIGSGGGAGKRRYQQQILRAVSRAGGRPGGGSRATRFHGNRIGRGAGIGRVLRSRDRYAAFRTRRVVIKTRIVKLKGQGLKVARLHLRYIQRDGVTRDGMPGELYDATHDHTDAKSFLARSDDDRHQFRFIVSAEDAVEYDELKGFVRRLMSQVEEDLGIRLDWVAVDHYNTGHPHSHIVVRGKDDRGRDLIIARDYIAQGMRERAAEIVTFDLGPRSDLEIENRLRQEVEQERFTSLDRNLLREAGDGRIVNFGAGRTDTFHHALRAGRLRKLERMELAEKVGPGKWRLDPELEPVLRRMGERGDIIKTMHRDLAATGLARAVSDYAIHDPTDADRRELIGRVVSRGLSDELNDRHYVIVDGVDGRTHYVEIGRSDATEATPQGVIVSIVPKSIEPRAADRTVAEVAAANGGRYGIELHLRHDPSASAAFAETHVRRLEAMRRSGIGVERQQDGTWIVTPDHLERAADYERMTARASPVKLTILSALPLDRQIGADAATWLDRQLTAKEPAPLRDAGFGHEAREALDRRRQWLVEQELANRDGDRVVYRANMLGLLQRRELIRVAEKLSTELGLRYDEAKPGRKIEGIYRRRLDLASGRFALIEKSREFTQVPWRPVLERNLGKPVSGIFQGDNVSWTLGRGRQGPTI